MEGNALSQFTDLIRDADSLVVLSVTNGKLTCSFSEDLTDHEVLDLLAFATTELYNNLDSTPTQH